MESCLTKIGEFQERTFGSMKNGDTVEDIRRIKLMNDFFFAVKSNDGSYWTGYNQWDKQIRKAKLFVSMKYANEVVKRYQEYNPKIVKVEIREVQDDE